MLNESDPVAMVVSCLHVRSSEVRVFFFTGSGFRVPAIFSVGRSVCKSLIALPTDHAKMKNCGTSHRSATLGFVDRNVVRGGWHGAS